MNANNTMCVPTHINDLITKRRKPRRIASVRNQYSIVGVELETTGDSTTYFHNHKSDIQAKYRENNKRKITQQKAVYREKNRDKIREYREKNRDKIREYREKNRDKIREYREKNRDKIREYREKNRDQISEQKSQYMEKYKENIKEKKSNYWRKNMRKLEKQNADYKEMNKKNIGEQRTKYREINRHDLIKKKANYRANNQNKKKCQYLRYKTKNVDKIKVSNVSHYLRNRSRVVEQKRAYREKILMTRPVVIPPGRKRKRRNEVECEHFTTPSGVKREWRNSLDYLMRKRRLWKDTIRRRLVNEAMKRVKNSLPRYRAVFRLTIGIKIEHELSVAFECQKLVSARMRKALMYLRMKYNDAESCLTQIGDGGTAEAALQGRYGGLRLHSRTNERYHVSANDRRAMIDNFYPEIEITDSSGNKIKKRAKTRKCDDACVYPSSWGSKFHKALSKFGQSLEINRIRDIVIDFEKCNGCISEKYPSCQKGNECTDWMKLTNEVSVHFQHMRTIKRKIYEVRQCQLWLMNLDSILLHGGATDLNRMVNRGAPVPGDEVKKSATNAEQDKRLKISDSYLRSVWGDAWHSYEVGLVDLPRHKCAMCGLLHRRKDMARKPILECPTFMEAEFIMWMIKHSLSFPMPLCNMCNSSLKLLRIPELSEFNNIGVDRIPSELQCLNDYEKLMIQMTKVFQTIVKLRPYRHSRRNNSGLVSALKGLAVHLPLPVENTIDKVITTLPSKEQLHLLVDDVSETLNPNVLVDGVPTKEGRIWRSLVRMDTVVKALQWLKQNNPLYKNINIAISDKFQNLGALTSEPTIFFNEPDDVDVDDEFQKYGPSFLVDYAPHIMKQYTVTPLQQNQPLITDTKLYSMQKIQAKPVADRAVHLDIMCFPDLYPKGRFGIFQARPRKVGIAKIISAKLRHSDPRFRQNQQFLFFCLSLKDKRAVDSGIYASLKASRELEGMTAGALIGRVDREDEVLETKINQMFRAVVGSREYWYSVAGDLKALAEMHGSPTFFVTLSAAEYHWPELRKYLEEVNCHITDIDRVPTGNLCAIDPASVVRFFEVKFQSMMKNVILKPEGGPLGQVEHYFWRREYQARGAPHFHMLLWIKGAPQIGENTDKEILEFLDGKLSCTVPDRLTSPTIYNLVNKYQKHKCSGSCMTSVKYGGIRRKRCRYGFPRTPSSTMKLNKVENSVKSRDRGGKIKKLVELVRSETERFINDYCPALLVPWAANMDVQYVGEMSMVLVNYLTAYVTKGEKNSTEHLWKHLDSNKSFYALLKSFAIRSLNNRECGAYEAADKLLGHKMYGMSQAAKFLDARMESERSRCLKRFSDLKGMAETDRNIYRDNLICNYYPDRSQSLEDVSIYDICAKYEFERGEASKTNHYSLKTIQGYFRERTKPILVKTPYIKPTGDGVEKYFHQLLFLFKPWRRENDLLNGFTSYQEAFESFREALPQMITFHRLRKRILDADELAAELRATKHTDLNSTNNIPSLEVDHENPVQGLLDEDNIFNEVSPVIVDPDSLVADEARLNEDQMRVYREIVTALEHQKHTEVDENSSSSVSQFMEFIKLFVSGVAGTGKSFLINLLRRKITSIFTTANTQGCSVAVLAPTGLAAFNVGGTTVHRFFKLPVQHGVDPAFWKLQRSDVKEMRIKYSNLRLIIIDEISMVSNVTLAMIHSRLDEIFGGSERGLTFGGKNIVVLGDLLQLPPVNSNFCFERLGLNRRKHVFNGVCINFFLWEEFQYHELTMNMRQADDREYADLLSRVRTQVPTDEDIRKLEKRLISSETLNTADAVTYYLNHGLNQCCMCICPLNRTVDMFNVEALKQLGIEIICIKAHDTREEAQPCTQISHDQAVAFILEKHAPTKKGVKNKLKTSDTAGLEQILLLGIGARVMLRKNVDQKKGLINGALGILRRVICNHRNFATHLEIEFDGIQEHVRIERSKVEFEVRRNVRAHRSQFSVSLAFAMTVHKSQGLSLDSVLLDVGDDIFDEGMAYVALSRARNYNGVHLLGFNAEKIMASIKAVREYNRLREKFTDLPQIALPRRKNMYAIDKDKRLKQVVLRDNFSPQRQLRCPFFLRLENSTGVSCYANALVQGLLQCERMFQMINSDGIRCSSANALNELYCKKINQSEGEFSCESIRMSVADDVAANGGNWDLYRQMDVHEFWMKLLTFFPQTLKELFIFESRERHVCVSCGKVSFNSFEVQNNICVYPWTVSGDTIQFKSLFQSGKVTKRCCSDLCLNVDTLHDIFVEHRYPESNRYVMMQMNLFVRDEQGILVKKTRKINGFGARRVKILGERFETIAAVKHEGVTILNGHYTAIVYDRMSKMWHEISDNMLREVRHQFTQGMKDIYIVLMKRIG